MINLKKYEASFKVFCDYEVTYDHAVETAYKERTARGMTEELSKEIAERKIEIAHNRKALSIDVQVIVQSAGLSENEIGNIQTKR